MKVAISVFNKSLAYHKPRLRTLTKSEPDRVYFAKSPEKITQTSNDYDYKNIEKILGKFRFKLSKLNTPEKRIWENQKEILNELGVSLSKAGLDEKVGHAILKGAAPHKNCKYGGIYPYSFHLVRVTELTARAKGSVNALMSAPLHDVVDDHSNQYNAKQIGEDFGQTVKQLVLAHSYKPLIEGMPSNGHHPEPKEIWAYKQLALLEKIQTLSKTPLFNDFIPVKMADTANGLEISRRSLKRDKEVHWNAFKKYGKQGQLWKQISRIDLYKQYVRSTHPLMRKINRDLKALLKNAGETKQGIRQFNTELKKAYGQILYFQRFFEPAKV